MEEEEDMWDYRARDPTIPDKPKKASIFDDDEYGEENVNDSRTNTTNPNDNNPEKNKRSERG